MAFEQGPNSDGESIWSAEPGMGVAWFFDPDHNRLSVSGPVLMLNCALVGAPACWLSDRR